MNKPALEAALFGTVLVAVVLVFAEALALQDVALVQFFQTAKAAPLGQTTSGEASTGLLYLVPTIVFTFVLAIGIKRNPNLWLKVFLIISLGIGSVIIGFLAYWWWLGLPLTVTLVLSLVAALLIGARVKNKVLNVLLSAPYKIWLGVGIAFVFFTLFPFVTALVLCGAFAVWDLYAVFRGPLKSIVVNMKEGEKKAGASTMFINAMTVNFGMGAIGLGDVTFYALMIMLAMSLGSVQSVAAFFSIIVGVLLTFYLLKSGGRFALPGLPLPVLFFVISLGVTHFVF